MNEEKKKGERMLIMAVILFLIVGLAAIFWVGKMQMPDWFSKNEVTVEKAKQIKKGMDQLEVRAVLGAPESTGTATMLDFEGLVDSYKNSKKDLQVNVIFKDGKAEMMTINQDVVELSP